MLKWPNSFVSILCAMKFDNHVLFSCLVYLQAADVLDKQTETSESKEAQIVCESLFDHKFQIPTVFKHISGRILQ